MLSIQQFLAKKWHDPYAPPSLFTQSCPSDIFLFPQMKKVLTGKCFANVEQVQQKMAKALKGIKINEFKNCFEQLKKKSL